MSIFSGQFFSTTAAGAATAGPVGAAVGIASSLGIKIPGISFKASSEHRARGVVPRVLQSALAGNLTAVRALSERRFIGIQAERQVWASAYDQLQQQRPDLVALFEANKTSVPSVDNSGPEAAANSALGQPYSVGQAAPAPSSVAGGVPNALDSILDLFGLGPQGQQRLAATAGSQAGQQAGAQISAGIVKAALIVAVVVLAIVLLRRR